MVLQIQGDKLGSMDELLQVWSEIKALAYDGLNDFRRANDLRADWEAADKLAEEGLRKLRTRYRPFTQEYHS